MLDDSTTFFLSFLTVFAALAWYLWHLDRKVDALAAELAESTTAKNGAEVERL